MKKQYDKKILVIICSSIFLGVIYLAINIYRYISLKPISPDLSCQQKPIQWDNSPYMLSTLPYGGKIVLNVKERNKQAWYTTVKPLNSPDKQFRTCVKGVKKYPIHVEQNSNDKYELEKKSKGLEVSIGIQKPFSYTTIAQLTFNIELYANKFNDDYYNLDAALENIAQNYVLEQGSDSIWYLRFIAPVGATFDTELPFYYEFAYINDKEISPNSRVEFISKDKGSSWTPLILN